MNKTKQYSVERGFISKLIETKDFKTLKDKQIQPFFLTGDNRRVFQYISDIFKETGEVPTPRVIGQKFPNYELETHNVDDRDVVGTDETLLYWCKELRTKAKHNRMADIIEEVADKLDNGESEDAYSTLKKGVWKIEDEIVESDSVDITKNTDDRKKAYLERKENRGMMGIPTGITHIDYMLKGLIKETLTTLIATTGVGKRLDLNTPILTPHGFVPLRDIHVGSTVCGEDGKFYKVVKETPVVNTQIHRVHFEDGTYVDCCKDHLWKFKTRDDLSRHNDWRVETTEQLLQRPIKSGKSYNLMIPVSKAIEFEEKNLPLDPYVLGCLLGDGGFTTDNVTFTNTEKDVIQKVISKLDNIVDAHKHGSIQYVFTKKIGDKHNQLNTVLRELGLLNHDSLSKFIPQSYLLGSVNQRLELLRGLIDTDGSVNRKGHVSYSTSSKKLKDDIMSLIRSLGFRCSFSEYSRDGIDNVEYVIRIWSDKDIFFTSEKHTEKYTNRIVGNRPNHYDVLKITDIEVLDSYTEMKCLSVDSPDHTFICGDYIVTHNTWFLILVGAYVQLNGYKVVCFITEMSADIMRDRFEAMLFGMMYGDFNYNNFKSGMLSKEQEDMYFEFLEDDLPKLEPLVLETATGVSSIVSVIEQEKPDLVLVDGAYLMEDEQGAKDDWLRVTHITRDLKKIAKNWHIPILINTQADQNTSKKTGPGLSDIKYSQAIGQDSDNILALFRDEVMINDNEMGVRVLKQREGVLGKAIINWNFHKMNFKSIYAESSATDFENNGDEEEAPNEKTFSVD